MKLLLDTHALFWWVVEQGKLFGYLDPRAVQFSIVIPET